MLGMSGGVDSSVAAYLLKKQGYDVVGVTLKLWQEKDTVGCTSTSAVDDAKNVADKLGIPFYVFDFEDLFEKSVVEYFTEEYLNGRTPNPCIACNKHIKFDAMLKKADEMGIDYIATGHYATILYDEASKRYQLKKSKTDAKDQTYVLYNLTQEKLSRIVMPLGNYEKDEIRKIAQEIGIDVANKPDSQEICFVADNDYAGFIERRTGIKLPEGDFLDVDGNVIGKHKGIIHYTVGQRKGLGAFGKPMFVVSINPKDNTVILGEKGTEYKNFLVADKPNFISFEVLSGPLKVKCKVRYNQKEVPCTVYPIENDRIRVDFDSPQRAVTPGQAVVFYDGDIVVGGATIIY